MVRMHEMQANDHRNASNFAKQMSVLLNWRVGKLLYTTEIQKTY